MLRSSLKSFEGLAVLAGETLGASVCSRPLNNLKIDQLVLGFGMALWGILASGCARLEFKAGLPEERLVVQGPLRVHSDFEIASEHRLLTELCERKSDMQQILDLDLNAEPIDVYLFADGKKFHRYLKNITPGLSDRRALFLEDDIGMRVVAHWSPSVGEDLRHELAHGYLHSSIRWLPLWLDEGLAEYFERPRGAEMSHPVHLAYLTAEFRAGRWHPDLKRLESCEEPSNFGQAHYAESWLWVHFLLNGPAEAKQLFLKYVQTLASDGARGRHFSDLLVASSKPWDVELLEHLKSLVDDVASPSGN